MSHCIYRKNTPLCEPEPLVSWELRMPLQKFTWSHPTAPLVAEESIRRPTPEEDVRG